MNTTTIIGFLAGAMTTISLVPQLIKAWQTRSTKDISIIMYIVFIIGLVLWLTYGILLNSLPIIVTNIITLTVALLILLLKIRFK